LKKFKTNDQFIKAQDFRDWHWFVDQLGVKMHKLITNDQTGKDTELWGWQLSLLGVKLHEIQS